MPIAATTLLARCAEAYAGMGWRVFPCAPRSKIPLTDHGCSDASADLERVRAWWMRWPDANIGIATGEGSGLFVYDIDGEEGEASHRELVATHGEMPACPLVFTGKGRHMYFAHHEGARNSSGILGARIDTRGAGGYVIAPPSIHPSGAIYAWASDRAPADIGRPAAPAWVAAALEKKKPQTAPSTWTATGDRDAAHERKYALGALRLTHDDLARETEGVRNERLRDAAYSLGGYVPAITEQEIRDALHSACVANGSWASEEPKCRDTLERAMAKGIAAPRDIPPPRHLQIVRAAPRDLTPADVVPLGPAPVVRKWKLAAELAMELTALGPGLPTGFRTLDEWTRGGLRAGKLVALGGAPGAGKTLFATQLAHGYHDLGHPVAFYAVDESREGAITRWGQQCGLLREDIEAAHEYTRAALSGCFGSGLADFVDPDEATLDEVGAFLVARAGQVGLPGVLVVDSIQTCRIEGGDHLEPRQRVDGVVALLKRLRKAGLLVIATSEVGRGWYRGGPDKVDPLAAFKESGGIEYALDVALVLESVKGETGQVDVWVPKSRLGRADRGEPACRARIDFARADMSEIASPAEGDGEPYEHDDSEDVERVAHEIERALVTSKGAVTTRKDLERIVPRGQRLTTRAVSLLLRDGRITGGRGVAFSTIRVGGEK